MTRRLPADIGTDLKAWLAHREMTEQELADAVNAKFQPRHKVSQPWVSRICNGKFKRYRGQVELVLRYADIPIASDRPIDPLSRAIIDDALEEVWDGSEGGAKAIAQVLRLIGKLALRRGEKADHARTERHRGGHDSKVERARGRNMLGSGG